MTSDTYTAWQLARLAGCSDPDSDESPGAQFLTDVESSVREAVRDGWWSEDAPHEIADAAVPVYTYARWQTFTDLGAWDEDVSELGAQSDDLTACAGVALYMIGERLADALGEEIAGEDEEDEEDSDVGEVV